MGEPLSNGFLPLIKEYSRTRTAAVSQADKTFAVFPRLEPQFRRGVLKTYSGCSETREQGLQDVESAAGLLGQTALGVKALDALCFTRSRGSSLDRDALYAQTAGMRGTGNPLESSSCAAAVSPAPPWRDLWSPPS